MPQQNPHAIAAASAGGAFDRAEPAGGHVRFGLVPGISPRFGPC